MIIQRKVDKDSFEYLSKKRRSMNMPGGDFFRIILLISLVFFCIAVANADDKDTRGQEKKDNGRTCSVSVMK